MTEYLPLGSNYGGRYSIVLGEYFALLSEQQVNGEELRMRQLLLEAESVEDEYPRL